MLSTVFWVVKWALALATGAFLLWFAKEVYQRPRGWLSKLSALTGWRFAVLERERWRFYPVDPDTPSDSLIVSFAGAALLVGGYASAEFVQTLSIFKCDQLYLTDPAQSFYMNDAGYQYRGYELLYSRLATMIAARRYKHVMLLGASMGATATLIFSPLASAVLAFNPMVNLRRDMRITSRYALKRMPSRVRANFYENLVLGGLQRTRGRVTVLFSGDRADADQSRWLPGGDLCKLEAKAFPRFAIERHPQCPDHGLPKWLKKRGQLVPLIERVFGDMLKDPPLPSSAAASADSAAAGAGSAAAWKSLPVVTYTDAGVAGAKAAIVAAGFPALFDLA